MSKKSNTGFSLIELMVVVAILATLVTIAAPSFSSIINNNRIDSTWRNVHDSMQFARSEAVKRNGKIEVCVANADQDACAADTTDWSSGWLVVHGRGSADFEVLKVGEPIPGIEVGGPSGTVEYLGMGAPKTSYAFTVTGRDKTKNLCVRSNGSIKEVASCS